MSPPLSTVIHYLRHRIRARSKYGLHSPFVFTIWSQILNDKSFHEEYRQIEKLRSQLLKDNTLINITDLGAGTGQKSSGIQHPASGIQHPASSLQHPASSIQHPASGPLIVPVKDIVRRSCVNPAWGRLLFRMAGYFKPAVTVELGTSLGISTAYLAMGNPHGQVITIEGCPETAALAGNNFGILHLTNIRQETGPFEEILPGLLDKTGKVGLFFIDGNHRKEPSLQYFHQCLQHIRDDSVLILDDIHWSAEMEEAWEEIKQHPSVTLSVDLFRMGLVFFKEGLSREDFILHLG
jgi:predicted O-methyltransferase YrrM